MAFDGVMFFLWSVNLFTTNVKQFILTAHTRSMPIRFPNPDYKVEVRRLDVVEDLSFPGTVSRTTVTTDRVKLVMLNARKNLIFATSLPGGIEDFLGANVLARRVVQ